MTNWKKYFRMIGKKIWIVILITAVFVSLASYIAFYKIKPQYQSSTRLFAVIKSEGDRNTTTSYQDLLAGPLLGKNYKELITSQAVISEVVKRIPTSGMTDEELTKRIDVELIPDSSMIRISVSHENPNVAAEIANEVSIVFIQKASELLKNNSITLVDKAIVSTKPISPRRILISGFSFLAGLSLSLGLILVLVYLDDSIGNLEEVEKKTGLLVVGIIPDMKIR